MLLLEFKKLRIIWSFRERKKYIQSDTIKQPKVIYKKKNISLYLSIRIIKVFAYLERKCFYKVCLHMTWYAFIARIFKEITSQTFLVLLLAQASNGFQYPALNYSILYSFNVAIFPLPLRPKKKKPWKLLRCIQTRNI